MAERPVLPAVLPAGADASLLPVEPLPGLPGMEAVAVEVEPRLPEGLCGPGVEALEPAAPPVGEGMLALAEEDPEELELVELELDELELDELELELDELELDELELGELELGELELDGMEGVDGMLVDCDGCCCDVVSQALSNRPPATASISPRRRRPVLSEVFLRYFMRLSIFQNLQQPGRTATRAPAQYQ